MAVYPISALGLLYISVFGLVGIYTRVFVNQFVGEVVGFPVLTGTFFVNVLGSLLIGLTEAAYNLGYIPLSVRIGLTSGLFGGLTTFSGYANDATQLFVNGKYLYAILYILITPAVGIGACVGITFAMGGFGW